MTHRVIEKAMETQAEQLATHGWKDELEEYLYTFDDIFKSQSIVFSNVPLLPISINNNIQTLTPKLK